jgi:hypothetical protein
VGREERVDGNGVDGGGIRRVEVPDLLERNETSVGSRAFGLR